MDMKWTYLLAVIIYGVLFAIKMINKKISYDFTKGLVKQPIAMKGFKKDFYSSVAIICIVISIGINVATTLTGHGINIDSIIVTILVMGMAFISGMTHIFVNEEKEMCIAGYILKKGDIKSFKEKGSRKLTQEIIFAEPIGGYDGIVIKVPANQKKQFIDCIQCLIESNEN
ncbi:MAG: hypothetical protein AB9856_18255 [Cellulosilyticaceae bacterium]